MRVGVFFPQSLHDIFYFYSWLPSIPGKFSVLHFNMAKENISLSSDVKLKQSALKSTQNIPMNFLMNTKGDDSPKLH